MIYSKMDDYTFKKQTRLDYFFLHWTQFAQMLIDILS